jgi:hypothetical protein
MQSNLGLVPVDGTDEEAQRLTDELTQNLKNIDEC